MGHYERWVSVKQGMPSVTMPVRFTAITTEDTFCLSLTVFDIVCTGALEELGFLTAVTLGVSQTLT